MLENVEKKGFWKFERLAKTVEINIFLDYD